MTVPFRIREAGLDDNDRLIELARHCPTQGRISSYSDRYPDFFALTRQQGERSFVYVAESLNGDLVASAVFLERSENRNGLNVKVLHFGDMRVHPAVRRTRVSAKLIQIYNDLLKSGKYDHGVVEILKSNTAPSRANILLRSQMNIRSDGHIMIYKLLPVWNYKISKDWTYRQAKEQDLPRLAKLLHSVYQNVDGAPSFSIEWLQEALNKHSSFSLANIWVAQNADGEISACLAHWDQSALRKTIILRYSGSLKFIVRLLATLGLLWQLPPSPKAGRSLHFQYFRWLAAKPENIRALQSLVRCAMRKSREGGKSQFIMVGFHPRDPLKAAIRGILKFREPMHVYSHRLITQASAVSQVPAAPGQSLYVDLALI